jgi:hypothetical protein
MSDYERPEILASYAAADLVSDAASCVAATYDGFSSDEALKDELIPIDKPLGGLKDVGTDS